MRGVVFVIATVVAANPTHAACSKPQAPSCAIEGAFAQPRDQDECRLQMLPYKGGMEAFAECLRGEGQDEMLALTELDHTLAEFNRRSRQLPADDL